MADILVLGAGMVAGPLVRYLLDGGARLTVTSLEQVEAERLVGGHPLGTARNHLSGDRGPGTPAGSGSPAPAPRDGR